MRTPSLVERRMKERAERGRPLSAMVRGGFTMVEMLIVVVVVAVVVVGSLRLLVTNQRTYAATSAQIEGKQTLRGAADILSSALREVSPSLGDIVMMSADSLRVRGQRGAGFICHDSVRGNEVWRVARVGSWLKPGDSVFVFAENDAGTSTDDSWILTAITSVDTTTTCGGDPGQLIAFTDAALFATDSVSTGGLVRAFSPVSYGRMTYSGAEYVGTQLAGDDWSPLVGPVTSDGLSFRYLDVNGVTTAIATNVAQFEVTVRTEADIVDAVGNAIVDSMTIRIDVRN